MVDELRTTHEPRVPRRSRRGEDGAVIVEFAAVFVVFAMLLAGLITYGMVFAVQQSLEHATSEAARAVVGISDQATAEQRMDDVLDDQLSWLGGLQADPGDGAWIETRRWDACGGECLVLQVSYRGDLLGLMPFQIATPDQLAASATLYHDLGAPQGED